MAFLKVDTRPLFPKVRSALLDLLGALDDAEWKLPTVCEGWDVKDITLHLLGVEIGNIARRRDGMESGPGGGEELVEWLNAHNEEWVRTTRRMSPRLLLELLRETGEMFDNYLKNLEVDAVTASVSWVGDESVPVWLDVAREYTERWVHQQQIRDATERPGLREPDFMEPVLQTFVHALPRTYGDIDANVGSVVQLEVEGPGGGTWRIVRSATAWDLEAGSERSPDAVVTMDVDSAWRVFTRDLRVAAPAITGDEILGRHMMNAVAIIA
jgi:uncharacterized protein (TIGR03083 family)